VRILLVEDEAPAAKMLAKGLREDAYAVDVAMDGDKALEQAGLTDYDLIILDVMLPRKDGLEVCRELRAAGYTAPILMLTARDAVEDRVAGLDTGADDYLVKPFDFEELLARVRALLRRKEALYPQVIAVADLSVNTRSRRVSRGGKDLDLTAKEYAFLEYLARRARESLDLAQERYRLGLSSIVELSQALLSVTVAEIESANAKYEYLIQRSALDYHRGQF
jgi:two-component system copper resistance phosphate regulon response regulator CusR